MSFRVRGLPAERFAPYFSMSDDALKHRRAMRVPVTGPGFPCRVSLTDASPGDTVILLHFEHHAVASPFRSSFAIYVREGERTFDAVNEVPSQLRSRTLSLRGFDADGMLRDAALIEGTNVEPSIDRLFEDQRIAYIHAHFAKPGCYAALIERA